MHSISNLQDAIKVVLRGKLIVPRPYIKNKCERSHTNNSTPDGSRTKRRHHTLKNIARNNKTQG